MKNHLLFLSNYKFVQVCLFARFHKLASSVHVRLFTLIVLLNVRRLITNGLTKLRVVIVSLLWC